MFPKAIRTLTLKNRTIHFLPTEDKFLIVKQNGEETKRSIQEMETLENSLQSEGSTLKEVKRIFSNKIISWPF